MLFKHTSSSVTRVLWMSIFALKCVFAHICVEWILLHIYAVTAIIVHPTIRTDVITPPTHCNMQHTCMQHTLHIVEKWEILYLCVPMLILACWLSDTDALKEVLLLTLQASSTKRWQGYERLARVHICIVILIIWFSSGCYCVPFYKSGYKIQTFIPAVPWARFSHLRILTDPLKPIACVLFLPEAL